MTTLKRIHDNKLKSEKEKQFKLDNYTPPQPISLISKIIKSQNLDLISFIAEKYDLSKSEHDVLIEKFIKVNYYCPEKILSIDKEKLQKLFV